MSPATDVTGRSAGNVKNVHEDGVDCNKQEKKDMLSNILKTAALATLVGAGVAGIAGSTSAAADSIRTDCLGDTCYRVHCDDYGDNCIRTEINNYDYDRVWHPSQTRYVCDLFGYDCRYELTPGYYETVPRYPSDEFPD